MLIRFRTSNFLSFHQDVELSFISGKGRSHPSHVIQTKYPDLKLLKSAVIYGANASGKSNLIKSIEFARDLIIDSPGPDQPIIVNKFKLDDSSLAKPSVFEFEFLLEDKIYSYGFDINGSSVLNEWLYDITTKTEKIIFDRKSESTSNFNFGEKFKNSKEKQFHEFVARGTRKNQLFLTEAKERNIEFYSKLYDWFKKKITILFPNSKPSRQAFQLKEDNKMEVIYAEILKHFDTGITGIVTKELDFEKELHEVPVEIKNKIKSELQNSDDILIIGSPFNKLYNFYKNKKGEIKSIQLLTKHQHKNKSKNELFELNEESDGTQRVIDLIPAIIEMFDEGSILFVDELDRSLHPILTKNLLKLYYGITKGKACQFITTTHESNLLDLNMLRKDEIWFAEKNKFGESSLYSLEEFKPRFDKEIRKGYLKGRFGAIPFIADPDKLHWNHFKHA